jgi:long-chain-alcohol oxidase
MAAQDEIVHTALLAPSRRLQNRPSLLQATSETWLVDAAKAGALILTRVQADQILVEPSADPLSSRQHRATGVVAKVGDRRLTVQARITVAAAGALHTPALLLRRCGPRKGVHGLL